MTPQPDGVVLHIEQGPESACIAWFQSFASQVSAHFSVSKLGTVSQYVDTGDAAWAEAAGNPRWISIEHEGMSGDALTPAQIAADGRIVAWLKQECGMHFPLTLTDQPGTPGIGWHGMGGAAWGNHPGCPGDPVKAQRPLIIAAALSIIDPRKAGPMRIYACTGQPTIYVDGGLVIVLPDGWDVSQLVAAGAVVIQVDAAFSQAAVKAVAT